MLFQLSRHSPCTCIVPSMYHLYQCLFPISMCCFDFFLLLCFLHHVPEKWAVWSVWCLANVDRFSKFFHQVIHKKILYVHITKISTSPAICCYAILWKSKIQKCYWLWQHLNRLLTCSWGHFEDLIYHLTVVRQTVSRLLILTEWLIWSLKFVRRRLELYSVEHCCIMAIFSLWLSSHHLRSC